MMINGAGATFPYPIYSKWFDEYTKVDPSVRFNYQSIGSGGGQKQIMAQTVDFGASDGPMSDDNLGKAPRKLLHIPTVAGAVVVTYNLEGNPALKLDADTIAGIFLGTIKKWNAPAIQKLNPKVTLPDESITPVYRSDGSGTTYNFTDYDDDNRAVLTGRPEAWDDQSRIRADQRKRSIIPITTTVERKSHNRSQ